MLRRSFVFAGAPVVVPGVNPFGVFTDQVFHTQKFPQVSQQLVGVPQSVRFPILRRAIKSALRSEATTQRSRWIRAHEGDEQYHGLPSEEKRQALKLDWNALLREANKRSGVAARPLKQKSLVLPKRGSQCATPLAPNSTLSVPVVHVPSPQGEITEL